jgi:pilus assembly protein Flp/PilA
MLVNLVYEMARRWRSDDLDEGATAVEYALLVGLIAVIIISSVTLLGGNIDAMFDDIASQLGGEETTPAP